MRSFDPIILLYDAALNDEALAIVLVMATPAKAAVVLPIKSLRLKCISRHI